MWMIWKKVLHAFLHVAFFHVFFMFNASLHAVLKLCAVNHFVLVFTRLMYLDCVKKNGSSLATRINNSHLLLHVTVMCYPLKRVSPYLTYVHANKTFITL